MNAGAQDCVVIIAAVDDAQAACAVNQVLIRARIALSEKPFGKKHGKCSKQA